jgi:hypothetical protein
MSFLRIEAKAWRSAFNHRPGEGANAISAQGRDPAFEKLELKTAILQRPHALDVAKVLAALFS